MLLGLWLLTLARSADAIAMFILRHLRREAHLLPFRRIHPLSLE